MPAASRERVRELAARLKKSERAIWYWVAQGCDLASEESIRRRKTAQKTQYSEEPGKARGRFRDR
jgi:hypothetical protein